MSGPQDGIEFDVERLPRGAPADSREPPGLFDFSLDANVATAEEVARDAPGRSHELRSGRLAYAAAELARMTGRRPDYYALPLAGEPANPLPSIDETTFWADLARLRRAQPDALKELGKDRADFDKRLRLEAQGAAAKRHERMAKGGFIGNLPGGLLGAMTDPVNLATLPIGGGGRTVAAQIIRNGLLNMGIEAAETPLIAMERRAQGRELTGTEAIFNIAAAGAGGAALTGLAIGGVKAAGAAIDAVPLDVKMALALRSSTKGDWLLTPDQAAALHVVERGGEIDAANPYQGSTAALERHAEAIDEALSGLARLPEPASSPPATVIPAIPRDAAGRETGGGLNAQILAGLQRRGFSEAQARGIAAGIHAESASNTRALNPSSGAMGLGQWLGPRKREIIRRYGPNPTLEQQLDFLEWELRGGDAGGASVLAQGDEAAVLRAYITDFMRPKAGAETRGDLDRGMAALGRQGEALPETAAAIDVPDEPLILRPEALDAARPLVTAAGREVPIASFLADEIDVDAKLMQFKSGGDQFGVTERLQGVEQWDPIAAGVVTVWEAIDGRRLIADGHQRLGLAKRIQAASGAPVRVNALVLREADGISAADARTFTALKNIGEGTGSAVDAAKIFREVGLDPELLKRLPPRSALVRDGKALARLSGDAFGAVINELIPENYAAAIGELAPDPASHIALVDLLVQADPPNRRQAEAIVRQALDSGFATEIQEELFGGRTVVSALILEKARLLDKTLSELRKLKGAFQVAARNAEALDAAGNRIDVDASTAAAAGNAQALALVEALALRKGNGVSEIFNRAAQRLADGEPLARVTRDTVAELRTLDLDGALRDAGGSGEASVGSGRGDLFGDEVRALPEDARSLTPAEQDEAEAEGLLGPSLFDEDAGKAFDDPAGDGTAAAADSVWHDIRAKEEFDEVWKSRDFKRAMKPLGELPHRESEVAGAMVRGWREGQAGDVKALEAEIDRILAGAGEFRPGGFNPRQGYLEAFYAAVKGETIEVRAIGGGAGHIGAATAGARIASALDEARVDPKLATAEQLEAARDMAKLDAAIEAERRFPGDGLTPDMQREAFTIGARRALGEKNFPVTERPELEAEGEAWARKELLGRKGELVTIREVMLIDLEDGKGERSIADIDEELEADAKAIDTIERCIAPKAPEGPAA